MRSKGENRNQLKPIQLNYDQRDSRASTASFFFEEPKIKSAVKRLSTEPSSVIKNFKKSRFCRYTSKTNASSLYKEKDRNINCLSKSQNVPLGLDLRDLYDWSQAKEKPIKIRKTNSKVGSILRALKGQLADRYLFRDVTSIQKVSVVGTKIL